VTLEREHDGKTAAERTALAFNEAITRGDVAALGRLMTDDHTFVDADDNVFSGKDVVLDAWRGFFEAFPGYRNVWTELTRTGDTVIALGHSICPNEPELDGPAIWAATVRDDRVTEWRIHEDTAHNRTLLALGRNS
jgi:ketosteroid isomerase-like protein